MLPYRVVIDKIRKSITIPIFYYYTHTHTFLYLMFLFKKNHFCAKCFRNVPQRHDSKVWRFSNSSTAFEEILEKAGFVPMSQRNRKAGIL